MERGRVIDGTPDSRLLQGGADPVTVEGTADEQVVDVTGLVLGELAGGAEPELGVPTGGLTTRGNPAVELREEDAQHGRLDLVEPRVVADQLEVDLVA